MPSVTLSAALRDEYQQLFDTCVIDASRQREVERVVDRIAGARARYEEVAGPLGIPWAFVACTHSMEASGRFDRHLHNGDPLTARTVQWPPGRPRRGSPPFTWEQSATDVLTWKRLDRVTDWTVAGALYRLEAYNGWGYRLYHPHVKSPYLWSATGHYSSGKYVADGRWSDTAVSRQIGAAAILRRLAERGLATLGEHGVPPTVERRLARAEPLLRHSRTGKLPYAEELQRFLNTFPGIYVKPDGWPGDKTSDAFRKLTGRYLHGDPRADGE
jgi:lysozyme family protein